MPTETKYLKSFACFKDLSDEQLNDLAEITDAVCYPPGHILFEEGQPAERLFFIDSGDIEVSYNIGESGPVCVDVVSGQEVVGCAGFIEPYTYTATERSLTQVEILEIDISRLRELMQADCQLGLTLQKYMLKVLMERILDLRLKAMPST